jgi:hypothetical protein
MKPWLLAIVAALCGLPLTLQAASPEYHPVAKIAATEGVRYTVVQDGTDHRHVCEAANERFLGAIKAQCPQCKNLSARCERKLRGFERKLHFGEAVAHPVVVAPGLRMAIIGPRAAATALCEKIAAEAAQKGAKSASCVQPAKR